MNFKELVLLANEVGIKTSVGAVLTGVDSGFKAVVKDDNVLVYDIKDINKVIASFGIEYIDSGIVMIESLGFDFNDIEYWKGVRVMIKAHEKFNNINLDTNQEAAKKYSNIIKLVENHLDELFKVKGKEENEGMFLCFIEEADKLNVKIPIGVGGHRENVIIARLEQEIVTFSSIHEPKAVGDWVKINDHERLLHAMKEKGFDFNNFTYWVNLKSNIQTRKRQYEDSDVALIGGIGKEEQLKQFDHIIELLDNHISSL